MHVEVGESRISKWRYQAVGYGCASQRSSDQEMWIRSSLTYRWHSKPCRGVIRRWGRSLEESRRRLLILCQNLKLKLHSYICFIHFSSTVCFYRNGNRNTLYLVLYILIFPVKNNLIKINDVPERDCSFFSLPWMACHQTICLCIKQLNSIWNPAIPSATGSIITNLDRSP